MKIHSAIIKFQKWKEENPDEEFQYDEIFDFIHEIGRGEIFSLLQWAEKTAIEMQSSNPSNLVCKNDQGIDRDYGF